MPGQCVITRNIAVATHAPADARWCATSGEGCHGGGAWAAHAVSLCEMKGDPARWTGPDGAERAAEIWRRLLSGTSLDGCGVGAIEGRWDLRGIPAPQPTVTRVSRWRGWSVQHLADVVELTEIALESLDFRGAGLA